jgi:hypothetical protein
LSKWFAANKLALNLVKTNIITFVTNNLPQYASSIAYNGKYVEEIVCMKFLGLQISNYQNVTNYIDILIPKLSAAYYAVRFIFRISSTDTPKSVYFACFHSVMIYQTAKRYALCKRKFLD